MAKTSEAQRTFSLAAVVLAVALVLSALLPVRANAAILSAGSGVDPNKGGKITVELKSSGKAVSGSVSVYKVATIVSDEDGTDGYHYKWTTDYADTSFDIESASKHQSLTDDDLKSLGASLEAKSAALVKTKSTDSNGEVTISVDKSGLFLVVTDVADGYSEVSPFVVAVPESKDGVANYQVDATPKVGTITQKSVPTPSKPTSSKPVYTHTAGAKLPQTGQLWWPVWILAAAGSVLVLAGIVARNRSGQKSDPAKA